jgi:hypothetical protein
MGVSLRGTATIFVKLPHHYLKDVISSCAGIVPERQHIRAQESQKQNSQSPVGIGFFS